MPSRQPRRPTAAGSAAATRRRRPPFRHSELVNEGAPPSPTAVTNSRRGGSTDAERVSTAAPQRGRELGSAPPTTDETTSRRGSSGDAQPASTAAQQRACERGGASRPTAATDSREGSSSDAHPASAVAQQRGGEDRGRRPSRPGGRLHLGAGNVGRRWRRHRPVEEYVEGSCRTYRRRRCMRAWDAARCNGGQPLPQLHSS